MLIEKMSTYISELRKYVKRSASLLHFFVTTGPAAHVRQAGSETEQPAGEDFWMHLSERASIASGGASMLLQGLGIVLWLLGRF